MNNFDDFDMLLKDKAKKDNSQIPDILDKKIDNILINLPNVKTRKRISMKVAFIAATISTIVITTTVMASTTPEVKNSISSVIYYFNNNSDTKYSADKSNFSRFNKNVGMSVEDKNIKFTVDNIAVDDNFINVFLTIENKNTTDTNTIDKNQLFAAQILTPFLSFKVNGKVIPVSNNNDTDAYFENDKNIVKSMVHFNVSQVSLPENFDLQIGTKEISNIKGNWNIATSVDKSEVAIKTKTVKPNISAIVDVRGTKHNITVDKVLLSPFGNQIVLSEYLKNNHLFGLFALFDDKGNALDVISGAENEKTLGKSTNSFEFIKGNLAMKYIDLVPINITESGKEDFQKYSISKFPITFKTSNIGSRVVDNVIFYKNTIKVNYHNEGVNAFIPDFYFYDASGNQFLFGDGECGVSTSTDKQKGEYTYTSIFTNKNIDLSKIAKIGTDSGLKNIELLDNQKIKINLEK